MFLLVVDIHRDIFIATLVTRRKTLVHGLGVDEELKGRTWLAFGCHLVVFPVVEVDVAHPCLDGTRLWFHGHKGTMHEGGHVLDGVFGCHHLGDGALVVIEYLDWVNPLLIIIVHRVGIVGEAGNQSFIERLALGNALNEVGDDLMLLVLPGFLTKPVGILFAVDVPVVVEVLLYLSHLFACGIFSILLHAGIYRGVYLQSAGIQVVTLVLAPVCQIVSHSLAEVFGLSVVVFLHLEVELDRFLTEGVVFLAAQVTMAYHIVEHHVASFQTVFGVGAWIIIGGSLKHTYEYGSLIGSQFLRTYVEVGLCRCLDAIRVGTEIYSVGIHRDDFLLGVDSLQLGCYNPFLALDDENAQTGHLAQQTCRVLGADAEHILCQLLGDGRSSSCIVMQQGILHGTKESDGVNTQMLVEALVLGVDQSLEEGWVYLFVFYGSTVLVEILTYQLAIGAVNLRSLAGLRIRNSREETWRFTKQPEEVNIHCT